MGIQRLAPGCAGSTTGTDQRLDGLVDSRAGRCQSFSAPPGRLVRGAQRDVPSRFAGRGAPQAPLPRGGFLAGTG